MNRKARRAAKTRPSSDPRSALAISDLLAQAKRHRQQGEPKAAERTCEEILVREPANVQALNILGLVFQESGRHSLAIRAFGNSIASAPLNAACHFNLANSCCALNRLEEAASHFKTAIILDDRPNNTESLILQNPVITACISRIHADWPPPVKELFAPPVLNAIAADLFLRCALETKPICGVALEKFLTLLRAAVLDLVHAGAVDTAIVQDGLTKLAAAIAQQCFINEFVYAEGEREIRQSVELRDMLSQCLPDGWEISPLLLAAVGAYFPLHVLPQAHLLLQRQWSGAIEDLLRLQVREPLAEAADRRSIAHLTSIADAVSLQVMRQYEENPYPRWTMTAAVYAHMHDERRGSGDREGAQAAEILIAGCGTGKHAIEVALDNRDAHVLGIDMSLASLCFARRKSREAAIRNIEFAQADILNLDTTGREFDRIEAVGVLHHLADPEAGWRVLLSLLRPGGVMRIGLYSETARRAVVSGRKLIAERGYQPTSEDIRKCRGEIFRDHTQRGWSSIVSGSDFYTMSGCRDMLFNVMEHRFTIPRIAAYLSDRQLSFLGFDVAPEIMEKFQKRFPNSADSLNLDKWHEFETENPQTFMQMYQFTLRNNRG